MISVDICITSHLETSGKTEVVTIISKLAQRSFANKENDYWVISVLDYVEATGLEISS